MSSVNGEDTVGAFASHARSIRLIRRQRATVLLLFVSLVTTLLYARAEKQRADLWRADALQLQSQIDALPAAPVSSALLGEQPPSATHYPTTLIAEDDSQTPLVGKAIHIDLGDGRLLEIELANYQPGYLHIWAPARPDDEYWNRLVFHTHCENSDSLELVRVSAKSGGSIIHLTR